MTRLLAVALVLSIGCSGSSSTEPDAGTDSGTNRDSSIFMGVDAGNDSGTDSGPPDSGMGVDAGFDAGTDAGPCDCAALGPCCDGCHLRDIGTPCAVSDSVTVASVCASGTIVNKGYNWLSCSASGQCNVNAGPGHVYWNCTGSCPGGQTCTGSCITSGIDRCAVYAGCAAGTPQAYFDLGICP